MSSAEKIQNRFREDRPSFSFEFFPPKSADAERGLWRTMDRLASADPTFVSVTYGAGGSTRAKTREIVSRILTDYDLCAMAHLTCVGATRTELGTQLDEFYDSGIRNILALRGDPPRGQERFTPVPGGCNYANDLVELIHENDPGRWCVGVAGFPESHPDADSPEHDIKVLKQKVATGADFVITQLFYDNRDYFRYVERARAAGVNCRILPGIMPLTTAHQLSPDGFIRKCGTRIPADLEARMMAAAADPDEVRRIGVDYAKTQCAELLAGGAPGIHFYTLNKSRATLDIHTHLKSLGH